MRSLRPTALPETFRVEPDGKVVFGDLVSADGNQKVYITSLYDWDDLDDLGDELSSYNYDMQDLTVDGKDAIDIANEIVKSVPLPKI